MDIYKEIFVTNSILLVKQLTFSKDVNKKNL